MFRKLKMSNSLCLFVCVIFLSVFVSFPAFSSSVKIVKLGLLLSSSEGSVSASSIYNKFLMDAVYYAIGKSAERLGRCGYQLEVVPAYFDGSNIFSIEKAAETLQANNTWLILAPRRSGMFLMARKGLVNTPMVSTLANADSVEALPAPYFSMSPTVDDLSKAAVSVAKKQRLGARYGAFVDVTCKACRDFAAHFDKHASKHFTKTFTLNTAGPSPRLDDLVSKIKKYKINFLLLPDDSMLVGYVISHLHKLFPRLAYLGGDGWGDGVFTFLGGYQDPQNIRAFSVRPYPSAEKMEEDGGDSSLNTITNSKLVYPPDSALATVDLIKNMVGSLCLSRAKTKKEYTLFLKNHSQVFKSTNSIGVYEISSGRVKYLYTIPVNAIRK